MSDTAKSLEFSRTINSPVEHLYFAFTTKMGLREWLSASAELYLKKSNVFSLLWEKDYAVIGEIQKTVENKKVVFTWQGLGDPLPTQVSVTLDPQDSGTVVTLIHSGFGSPEDWEEIIAFLTKMWDKSLDNLKQVMETGLDARLYNKPMMGIWLGDLVDQKIARKKNLVISHGLLLGGAIKGMGAEKAGMQAEDQIVEMDGMPIHSFEDIDQAISIHGVGDLVEIVYYRAGEKQTAFVELSHRPHPEVPSTAQALSEEVNSIYDSANAKMDEVFYQVRDTQAEFRPAPGEWNSKEVLAHLILGERDTYTWVATSVAGYEMHPFTDTLPARIKSTLYLYPQVPNLRGELKHTQDEGIAFLAGIPAEFVERRSSYVRVAGRIQDISIHYREHIEQIETNLAAAQNVG